MISNVVSDISMMAYKTIFLSHVLWLQCDRGFYSLAWLINYGACAIQLFLVIFSFIWLPALICCVSFHYCVPLFLSHSLLPCSFPSLLFSLNSLLCTYVFASDWKAICLRGQVFPTCLTPSFIRSFKPIKIDTRLVTSTERASSHVILTTWPLRHVTVLATL